MPQQTFKIFAASAALTFAGALSASAALIDFTDTDSYTLTADGASGTTAGVGWTITPSESGLNASEAGAGPLGPLAGENDGLGIGDDEITTPDQFVTITFDKVVELTRVWVLDFFTAVDGSDAEEVDVFAGLGDSGTPITSFTASTPAGIGPGIGAFSTSFFGTTFTFAPNGANDGEGFADFALAGIEFSEIPLPAGVLLLAGALGGLGLMRRRKQRTN